MNIYITYYIYEYICIWIYILYNNINKYISIYIDRKHYLSICNSSTSEILSLIAIRSKLKIITNIKSIIQTNKEYLIDIINKYPNIFHWNQSKGGCCGFIQLKILQNISNNILNITLLSDKLVNNYGILILPGNNFQCSNIDLNDMIINSYFRIGLGRKNFKIVLDKFIIALFEILKEYNINY